MREIRTFELDGRDAPTSWFIDRPQTLRATRGQIWLTIEGDAGDFWLDAGECVELQPFSTIWVSGARDESAFSLAAVSTPTTTSRRLIDAARAWLARRTAPSGAAISKA
ncbi:MULTISPECIES: DUF2917 domain-containing protein [unclassified Caballeronia]|uniref:DUF2917 domain-containing protein n=1 Tax=unclassified Caballeronia TaxID=2646786 RepID=UPI001FD5EA95|nr:MULTISPECIES: DUF2917 domain-containing protein [unclassified Caballeronia]